MCTGIARAYSELPLALIEGHDLGKRVHDRGGERELRFLYRVAERLLPVWHQGQLEVVRWGCRRQESRALPCTGWTWRATMEAGRWASWGVEPVDIPATIGLAHGVWYRIRQGIRGLRVLDEKGRPRVYLICEPASHSYEVMTRARYMPVLIGERI